MSESEDKNKKKDGDQSQDGQGREVILKVDRSEEMKDLQLQLDKQMAELHKRDESLKAKELELAKITEEKKVVSDENVNIKTQLETIAEKEWIKTKTVVKERVEKLFPNDEGKVKEIMGKLEDPEKGPENLAMTEYMMKTLEDSINKGRDEERKAKETEAAKAKAEAEAKTKGQPAGSGVPITGAQTGENQPEGYENDVALIRDVRRRSRDPSDPIKQAEAQAILDELFKKWVITVKKDFTKQISSIDVTADKDAKRTVREGA